MILCAGCRVAICSTSPGSTIGCLLWDDKASQDDFVYYCPYCARKNPSSVCVRVDLGKTLLTKSEQLRLRDKEFPDMDDVWFRYDAPVLLVSITWHGTRARFGHYLHNRLLLSYFGTEDLVSQTLHLATSRHSSILQLLRLDLTLDGSKKIPEPKTKTKRRNGRARKVVDDVKLDNPIAEAVGFLEKYKTAKIVIIVDTHCLESGQFVYMGDGPETYRGCFMEEVGFWDFPLRQLLISS